MRLWNWVLIGLVAAVTGCSKDDGAACPDSGTGTLALEIADVGITPDVDVTGRNAFSDTITTTGTLTRPDLPGGLYRVLANMVTTPAAGVDLAGAAYAASPNAVVEVCVKDGETTTVTVDYAEHATSGMLVVAQGGGADDDVVAFDQAKLTAAGSQAPDVAVNLASGNPSDNVVGMSFDDWGNLWLAMACACGDRLAAFSPGHLATGGDLDPAVLVLSTELISVRDLTLDASGNLWASNGGNDTIVGFSATQLADALVAGGQVTLTPTLTIDVAELDTPEGIEASGTSLLVANRGDNAILTIDTVTGTAATSAIVTGDTPSPVINQLSAPVDIVLQPDGDLWVSYFASNVLARYTPGQLVTGNYEPAPQVVVPVTALPAGLAVDAQGGVWSAQYEFRLQRTDAADYVVDSTALGDPQKLTFLPAP